MKRIYLILALFCLGATKGGMMRQQLIPAASGSDPLLPYLLNETFNTTVGYDLTWTETAAGGTINEDEVIIVGEGAQSLNIISTGNNDNTREEFTANDTAYGHVMFRYASLNGTTDLVHFRSSGGVRLIVRTSGAGALTLLHGSASVAVTDALSANTWVHIWFRYTKGTGADGVAEISWSTDTTRPTSGTKYATLSNGTATSTVNELYLGQNANETHTIYYDQAFVDEAGFPQP